LNILVDEGILYKKRGMGMFVTDKAIDIIKEKRRKEYLDNILPDLIKNIKLLGISKDELINEIQDIYNKEDMDDRG
ncbi:MAG: hypothetical protein E6687_07680, partial [Anaerococcus sp.]|nr:hypothetical protein [Anaerococcus sp.]